MTVGAWQWNDAWIFVSVVIADRTESDRAAAAALPNTGANLADVLSAADFLHNAVPMREQIEGAVRRLVGAGLINVDDDFFAVAAPGEQLWRTRTISGLSSTVSCLQTALNRAGTAPGGSEWTLDEPTYTAAVREYCTRVADSV